MKGEKHVRYYHFSSQENHSRPQIERFAAGLPQSVFRAKGVLYLEDKSERQMIFQLVGQRWSLTPGQAWGQQKPENHLVVISLQDQMDPSKLTAQLKACA